MRHLVWPIMLVGFFDTLGLALILPALPYISAEFAITPLQVGLLVATYPLVQAASSVILGRLSDRYGRRTVIILTVFGAAAANLTFGLASTLAALVIGRAVTGAMSGNMSVAYAHLADVAPAASRAKLLGFYAAVGSLGFIAGQSFSGVGAQFLSPRWAAFGPYLLLAASQVALGLLLLRVPGRPPPVRTADAGKLSLAQILAMPGMPVLFTWNGMVRFVFIGFTAAAPLYLAKIRGFDQSAIAFVFAAVGAYLLLVRTVLIGPAVNKLGPGRAIPLAFLSMGVGMALFPIGGAVTSALGLLALCTGYGVLVSMLLAEIGGQVREEVRGVTMGWAGVADNLGSVAGPVVAGFLFGQFAPASPFFVSAALCGICALLVLASPLRMAWTQPSNPPTAQEP